jgi:hypothetical protein
VAFMLLGMALFELFEAFSPAAPDASRRRSTP